jgi:hypothetical protein
MGWSLHQAADVEAETPEGVIELNDVDILAVPDAEVTAEMLQASPDGRPAKDAQMTVRYLEAGRLMAGEVEIEVTSHDAGECVYLVVDAPQPAGRFALVVHGSEAGELTVDRVPGQCTANDGDPVSELDEPVAAVAVDELLLRLHPPTDLPRAQVRAAIRALRQGAGLTLRQACTVALLGADRAGLPDDEFSRSVDILAGFSPPAPANDLHAQVRDSRLARAAVLLLNAREGSGAALAVRGGLEVEMSGRRWFVPGDRFDTARSTDGIQIATGSPPRPENPWEAAQAIVTSVHIHGVRQTEPHTS